MYLIRVFDSVVRYGNCFENRRIALQLKCQQNNVKGKSTSAFLKEIKKSSIYANNNEVDNGYQENTYIARKETELVKLFCKVLPRNL